MAGVIPAIPIVRSIITPVMDQTPVLDQAPGSAPRVDNRPPFRPRVHSCLHQMIGAARDPATAASPDPPAQEPTPSPSSASAIITAAVNVTESDHPPSISGKPAFTSIRKKI